MTTDPQWQFIGNVPENYERHLVPSIFAPWAHDLIEAATLRPGERVLDVACGTGIVARTSPTTLALRPRVRAAGFREIMIRPVVKILRFPSPDEFVLRYVAGSALASLVGDADDDARAALLTEVNAGLQSYVDGQGLAFPIESNVAVARK